jgi:ferritin-like metal-binding protein YciE
MAELTGHNAAIGPLKQTLQEEVDMASWLDANLARVTSTYVTREQQGVKAGI